MVKNLIEPIKNAYRILKSDMEKKNITGAKISAYNRNRLKIHLVQENRSLFLGYQEGSGYFISWDKANNQCNNYFLLEDATTTILELIPSVFNNCEIKQEGELYSNLNNKIPDSLLDSISRQDPDINKIEEIIEKAPTTEEGIDVLSTITSIKTFRTTIDKLKSLIESQNELKHPETKYKRIIASNPSMLGSHYTEVFVEEFQIWFNSRVDLLLGSVLGYVDIIELKRPDTNLLLENKKLKIWRMSQDLSSTIAQARKYLRNLDENIDIVEKRLRTINPLVSRAYKSSVIIVAGRTPKESGALDALKEINATEARIHIFTYDDIVEIAKATIKIFERRLKYKSKFLTT